LPEPEGPVTTENRPGRNAASSPSSAVSVHGSAPAPELGSEAIRTWVFRGHPYGHLMEGRQGTLETIRASEVRQFWADRYVRPAVAGCVVGAAAAGDALGKALTALPPRLYRDVIQPEEIKHHELARGILEKLCTTAELQEATAGAARNTLAIADELRTLAEKSTGMHPIPVS